MDADISKTRELLHHHLDLATDLVARCQKFSHVKGSTKLVKKCQAELKFLEGVSKNLYHFGQCCRGCGKHLICSILG